MVARYGLRAGNSTDRLAGQTFCLPPKVLIVVDLGPAAEQIIIHDYDHQNLPLMYPHPPGDEHLNHVHLFILLSTEETEV